MAALALQPSTTAAPASASSPARPPDPLDAQAVADAVFRQVLCARAGTDTRTYARVLKVVQGSMLVRGRVADEALG